MKDTDKRALKFLAGFSASVFSLLGWVCVNNMSPDPYTWVFTIPIASLCAYINALAMTDWINK